MQTPLGLSINCVISLAALMWQIKETVAGNFCARKKIIQNAVFNWREAVTQNALPDSCASNFAPDKDTIPDSANWAGGISALPISRVKTMASAAKILSLSFTGVVSGIFQDGSVLCACLASNNLKQPSSASLGRSLICQGAISMKSVFTPFRVRLLSLLFMVLILLTAVIQPDNWLVQAKGQDWPLIESGQTVEKALPVGDTHRYRVKLEAGRFVLFEVSFAAGDVGLALYDSKGNLTYQQSRNARKASVGLQQTLRRVIESTDTYRLEISAKPGQKESIVYSLKIAELRAANDGDQRLQTAELWQQQASRIWEEQRSFDEGIALGEKALTVYQELSPTDADVGNVALLLQALYEKRGYHRDMDRRRELVEIALHNREALLGPNDLNVALLYDSLADLVGPAQASKYFEKEMEIVVQAVGPKHQFVGNVMSNWANNFDSLGDKEKAAKMYEDAARVIEESSGPYEPLLCSVYLNLSDVRLQRKDWAGAIRYTQKALAIIEKHGDKDYLMTEVLSQSAEAYQRKGDFAQSDAYYQKLLAYHKAMGQLPHSPVWANAYVDMARRQIARGRLDEAAKLYEQAKKVLDLTGDSPVLAGVLREWSKLHLLTGRINDAVIAQQKAAAISEIELQRLLAHGSESEKMKMLFLAATELAEALSLHADYAPKSDEALRLAFTMLLQRKGRVLDEMNRTIAFLRSSAKGESSELIERWIDLASEISVVSSRRAGDINVAQQTARLEKLNKEFEALQLKIGARSPEFRAQVLPPVTLEDVQKAMPTNSALIEFAQYIPEDIRTNQKSEPRYLAYVLPKVGKPEYVPLESVQKIDSAIHGLRQAFRDQENKKKAKTDLRPLLRELDRLVMQPIRPRLGQANTIFLAPDGELNLVPFAALRDKRGRYLLEDKLFVYLTSGRDLIRLQIKHQSQLDKLIFAINDFNTGGAESALPIAKNAADSFQNSELSRTRGGRLSEDETMATLSFPELKQARSEGEIIGRIFPDAKLFVDEQAIETTLKQVRRPYWLHLATHGFFLPNPLQAGVSRFENPLLRSGLALAGANARKSGNDDGILTAFEVAALDLWGTKLVVLSACETGNGEVKTGEGVMGLRRAFVLAGVETQVSSLWRASDDATPKLMQYFYSNLKANMGRAEALQKAQLKMLKEGISAEPYYWANFICIGEWKSLNQ